MSALSFMTAASGFLTSATTSAVWVRTDVISHMNSESMPGVTESPVVPVGVSHPTVLPHPLAIIPLASSVSFTPDTHNIALVSTTSLAGPTIPTSHPRVIIPLVPTSQDAQSTGETPVTSIVSPSEIAIHPLATIPRVSNTSAQDTQPSPFVPVTSVLSSSIVEPHTQAIIPIIPTVTIASNQSIHPVPTTLLLTVTETSTVTVASSPTAEPPPAPSSSPTTPSPYRPITEWSSPVCMADLDAFNVTKFSAGGRRNLRIVSAADGDPERRSGEDCTSILRLFYPAGSINPAQHPVGGAQFYAAPLDLRDARSVTLQYSVFFPEDFDFVLGGKLPGIYGGRMGCSGGDSAVECFSTRLMWRRHGMGELYMYAPKEEQTEDLCSDSRSVCHTQYGFSIGRGSFKWATGAWTTVRQTVTLNTPGKQDGAFVLEVNGERVIERNDVFYRYAPRQTHDSTEGEGDHSGLGGIIGPLLSDLLPRAPETETEATQPTPILMKAYGDVEEARVTQHLIAQQELEVHIIEEHPVTFGNAAVTTAIPRPQQQLMMKNKGVKPVGFEGLFFSTFFGGHDYRYATPRDQYVWFRGFAMSKNV